LLPTRNKRVTQQHNAASDSRKAATEKTQSLSRQAGRKRPFARAPPRTYKLRLKRRRERKLPEAFQFAPETAISGAAMKRQPELLVQADCFLPTDPWSPSWTPEGVIETLEPLSVDARRARLWSVIKNRIGNVTLLMDAPHDPHNAAAILRSCDAFGIPRVHLLPREEDFAVGRTVAKGAERWIEVVPHTSPEQALASLHDQGFTTVATHPEGNLAPEDLATLPRVALILGNEHDGIRDALHAGARESVRIPMRGFVESFNVSVAAAILLYAATRGRAGDLSEAEQARLYARALVRSVPRALAVLDGSRAR
jgi:tRNA (guanosine-2'-O-)-methyltransferase